MQTDVEVTLVIFLDHVDRRSCCDEEYHHHHPVPYHKHSRHDHDVSLSSCCSCRMHVWHVIMLSSRDRKCTTFIHTDETESDVEPVYWLELCDHKTLCEVNWPPSIRSLSRRGRAVNIVMNYVWRRWPARMCDIETPSTWEYDQRGFVFRFYAWKTQNRKIHFLTSQNLCLIVLYQGTLFFFCINWTRGR